MRGRGREQRLPRLLFGLRTISSVRLHACECELVVIISRLWDADTKRGRRQRRRKANKSKQLLPIVWWWYCEIHAEWIPQCQKQWWNFNNLRTVLTKDGHQVDIFFTNKIIIIVVVVVVVNVFTNVLGFLILFSAAGVPTYFPRFTAGFNRKSLPVVNWLLGVTQHRVSRWFLQR